MEYSSESIYNGKIPKMTNGRLDNKFQNLVLNNNDLSGAVENQNGNNLSLCENGNSISSVKNHARSEIYAQYKTKIIDNQTGYEPDSEESNMDKNEPTRKKIGIRLRYVINQHLQIRRLGYEADNSDSESEIFQNCKRSNSKEEGLISDGRLREMTFCNRRIADSNELFIDIREYSEQSQKLQRDENKYDTHRKILFNNEQEDFGYEPDDELWCVDDQTCLEDVSCFEELSCVEEPSSIEELSFVKERACLEEQTHEAEPPLGNEFLLSDDNLGHLQNVNIEAKMTPLSVDVTDTTDPTSWDLKYVSHLVDFIVGQYINQHSLRVRWNIRDYEAYPGNPNVSFGWSDESCVITALRSTQVYFYYKYCALIPPSLYVNQSMFDLGVQVILEEHLSKYYTHMICYELSIGITLFAIYSSQSGFSDALYHAVQTILSNAKALKMNSLRNPTKDLVRIFRGSFLTVYNTI